MPEIDPFGWQGVPSILEEVAMSFGLTVEDLKGSSQKKTTTLARYVAAFLIHELCSLSWPEQGELFDRDHTTVLNGVRSIEKKMREDGTFLKYVALVKSRFTYSTGEMDKTFEADLQERYGND